MTCQNCADYDVMITNYQLSNPHWDIHERGFPTAFSTHAQSFSVCSHPCPFPNYFSTPLASNNHYLSLQGFLLQPSKSTHPSLLSLHHFHFNYFLRSDRPHRGKHATSRLCYRMPRPPNHRTHFQVQDHPSSLFRKKYNRNHSPDTF